MPEITSSSEKRALFIRQNLPILLLLTCPPFALTVWHMNVEPEINGSFMALFDKFASEGFFTYLWGYWEPVFWGTKSAWMIIGIFGLIQLVFMKAIPGKTVFGPLTPKGNTPVYKENGLPSYLLTMGLFYLCAWPLGLFKPSIVYDNFGGLIGALNIFSLFFCLILYLKGRFAPTSSDSGLSGNFIFDYYWGTELYPRVLGWDIKQFTNCRFGMMGWPVIIVSFAAAQHEAYGISNSMLVAMALQLIYITKFFIWEIGYLRSIDIMYDRAGFYICWGCLVWVPSVYTSHTLYLVNHPNRLSIWLAVGIFVLGTAAILINYFTDRQRQVFREKNGETKIWGKDPVVLHARYVTEGGEEKESLLLASGYWGLSRNFRYVPEILAAFFWSVPAMFDNLFPYFYVIFLTILLIHRAYRIEARCELKYGKYWDEYRKLVPNLILPRLFKRS